MSESVVGDKQEHRQRLQRRRGVSGLARMLAGLLLALLAQSEAGAGRAGNCLALYAIAAVLYLSGRPLPPFLPVRGPASGGIRGWRWLLPGLSLAVALGALSFVLFSRAAESLAPWRVYLLALAALLGTALAVHLTPDPSP
ncbi:MAG: hypothetical protein ACYC5O_05740, partial [Anaerolineae bacterium]